MTDRPQMARNRQLFELDLQFKKPAGTSKGILHSRTTWILAEEREYGIALGEAGPLSWLSRESFDEVREAGGKWLSETESPAVPSLRFAQEMLARDAGDHILFPGPFTEGKSSLAINGLVWMGPRDEIEAQVRSLLAREFQCIKMKVGAADWNQEIEILRWIKAAAPSVELRVDANGAWTPTEATVNLQQLAECGVKSIEQPIAPGQPHELAALCESSPVDIALDEELIRCSNPAELLDLVRPAGIVLKPSLIGGFAVSDTWIQLAEERGIYWWATSSLESGVGLNALAQWLAVRAGDRIHGLGTGSLYVENIESPLVLEGQSLTFDPEKPWNLNLLPGFTGQ
jgi:o-succinylbenzoate synthase